MDKTFIADDAWYKRFADDFVESTYDTNSVEDRCCNNDWLDFIQEVEDHHPELMKIGRDKLLYLFQRGHLAGMLVDHDEYMRKVREANRNAANDANDE